MSVHQFDVPIFGGLVHLHSTRAEFIKSRKKFKDAEVLDLSDSDGICSDQSMFYLVGVFDGKESTLIHELSHVTFKLLDDVNVPATRYSSEAYCHLVAWLYEESITFFRKEWDSKA